MPRPVPAENLHLTLLFLGELPEPVLDDVDLAFRQLRAPGFELALAGHRHVRRRASRGSSMSAPRDSPPLRHLQAKVETAARGAGVDAAGAAASCRTSRSRGCRSGWRARARSRQAVALRSGYAAPRFAVEDFRLFRSRLAASAAPAYEELARYPLG